MRTVLRAILVAALIPAALASCSDGGGGGGPTPPPSGTRVVTLSGDVTGSRTLRADSTYLVTGFLEVQPGAVLTVQAGTVLVSDINTKGSIVTLRASGDQPSGQLVVQGTAASPVVFQPGTAATAATLGLSPAAVQPCARGQGGGIVLHGAAPINVPGGTGVSEGVARPFGGTNPADDSGDIQFLVIACGGVKVTPDNEINGLTLSGVGTGTRISHVQTHLIADDGFEWFGGTVHADHLVSSGNDDDAFDCDFGWNGTVQFGVAVQDRNLANRGMECDNDASGSANAPVTAPTFWNFTWVGAGVQQANNEVNDGLYLRRNAAPRIFNSIVANFGNVGATIDGTASQAQAGSDALVLDRVLFFGNQALAFPAAQTGASCLLQNVAFRGGAASAYHQTGVEAAFGDETFACGDPRFTTVNFADPLNGAAPDLRLQAGSPALTGGLVPTGPGVDPSATYLGAFGSSNWTSGWTVWFRPVS